MEISKADIIAGQSLYSAFVLKLYDAYVIWFSNYFVWRCPSKHIQALYDSTLSNCHLDVGVGTGYFLKHCAALRPTSKLALLDLNPNCLAHTQRVMQHLSPDSYCADIFSPIECIQTRFHSIGLNYVLHCLPGEMSQKANVIAHLSALLTQEGVLFGSTILGKGVPHNALARYLLNLYNTKRIFSNRQDDLVSLRAVLDRYFESVEIQVVGAVALFKAKGVRRRNICT